MIINKTKSEDGRDFIEILCRKENSDDIKKSLYKNCHKLMKEASEQKVGVLAKSIYIDEVDDKGETITIGAEEMEDDEFLEFFKDKNFVLYIEI